MKTLKLLLILFIFSLQANATGYAHNMFVAHKKLRTGKESHFVKVKTTVRKANAVKADIRKATYVQEIATKVSDMATLNERVLQEGPSFLFEKEQEKETDDSLASKLADMVKCMVYAFAGSLVHGS